MIDPITSMQYSKWSITPSSECRGCAGEIVVCGDPSIPITPPFSATAFSRTSSFSLRSENSARAPECDRKTGRSLTSQVCIAVTSPVCETSIAMPSRFILRTASRPNRVRPPSPGSFTPPPSWFDSL